MRKRTPLRLIQSRITCNSESSRNTKTVFLFKTAIDLHKGSLYSAFKAQSATNTEHLTNVDLAMKNQRGIHIRTTKPSFQILVRRHIYLWCHPLGSDHDQVPPGTIGNAQLLHQESGQGWWRYLEDRISDTAVVRVWGGIGLEQVPGRGAILGVQAPQLLLALPTIAWSVGAAAAER